MNSDDYIVRRHPELAEDPWPVPAWTADEAAASDAARIHAIQEEAAQMDACRPRVWNELGGTSPEPEAEP